MSEALHPATAGVHRRHRERGREVHAERVLADGAQPRRRRRGRRCAGPRRIQHRAVWEEDAFQMVTRGKWEHRTSLAITRAAVIGRV